MKKTPPSPVRVQRGLISAPRMVSATDDDNDNAGGKRRTLANGNQRAAKVMAIGSDLDSNSDGGKDEGSEVSVPPQRATSAGSATPVKSGMKPRPRSKSQSRPMHSR